MQTILFLPTSHHDTGTLVVWSSMCSILAAVDILLNQSKACLRSMLDQILWPLTSQITGVSMEQTTTQISLTSWTTPGCQKSTSR